MIKAIAGGAVTAALLFSPHHAAAAQPARPPLPWVILPGDGACRVELSLTGASGGVTPLTLSSDGATVVLRFVKPDLPARAFLPIRIDRARYANLVSRSGDGAAEMLLSDESLAALRKGGALDVAWLAEEPRSASLAGSELGLDDLRTCGRQAAERQRNRLAAERAEQDRADAEARAREIAEAQVAAARAQAAAADAQRQAAQEAAERQKRIEAATQERLDREARDRAYQDARRPTYQDPDEDEERWAPPPQWRTPRPYERF